MTRIHRSLAIAPLVLACLCGPGFAAPAGLPVIGGRQVLATVNGTPVTRDQFEQVLFTLHQGVKEEATRTRKNPSELLDRMINAELILQEAKTIGLDGLPESKAALEEYGKTTLRQLLYSYHVRNLRKAEKKDVEKRYRDATKEVKVFSVLADKEEDARQLLEASQGAGDFHLLAEKMVSEKKATAGKESAYIKVNDLLPEVTKALSGMKVGAVSPVIKIGNGYSVFRLEDVRFRKSAAARKRAEEEALKARKTASLHDYAGTLKKRYVKIDTKLLDRLDFEAKEPGIEKMKEDRRILATVKGLPPVTVSELADALAKKFYHGTGQAGAGKVNGRKAEAFDEVVMKKVFDMEARRLRIDRTPMYKDRVEQFRRNLLFGAFLQRVIDPDIKVEDAEIRSYLEEHVSEYTNPETVRIEGIAFAKREDASDAADKLMKGADFQWIRENAPGRMGKDNAANLLAFDGNVILTETLPEDVQKALAGARTGEYRLYASPQGPAYVLYLKERIPSGPQPFETVREAIGKKLFEEKQRKAVEEYSRKLRKASDVKVFANGKQLEAFVSGPAR